MSRTSVGFWGVRQLRAERRSSSWPLLSNKIVAYPGSLTLCSIEYFERPSSDLNDVLIVLLSAKGSRLETYLPPLSRDLPWPPREIGELRKELERQREEAAQAKKALEDKIAEELVLKGELDADEVRHVQLESGIQIPGEPTRAF